MKKILFALALVLSLASFASAADSVLCTVTAPEGAQLERYPTSSGPLSVGQTADLGLHPVRLLEPTLVLNHHRNRAQCAGGTWSKETLPAGTLVLVDGDGILRYKQDCGNRLVAIPAKAQATIVPAPVLPAKGGDKADTALPASGEGGGWMSWWNMGLYLSLLFLGVALMIAFLAVLFWLLWHLFEWLHNNRPWRPIPAPLVPVAPVTTPITAPPPVARPLPATMTVRRYGPFKSVAINNRGVTGFLVAGDGHNLGIFSTQVVTEDAGPAGHYVVVTT